MAGLALRLGWLQVVRGPTLSRLAAAEHERIVPIPASRGEIVDRSGHVLAVSVPAATITADPAIMPNASKPQAAQALAGVLALPASQILALLQRPGQFVYLEQDATPAQGQAVRQLVSRLHLSGIAVTDTTVRTYPNGLFLGHTLGFLGLDGQPLEGQERIPREYLRSLFGPGLDAALDTLRAEMEKQRSGERSELMDILIARRWTELIGPYGRDPAEVA